MGAKISRKTRLSIIIGISFAFFVGEIGVAIWTKSLALLADAFHYLNDLVGFVVALVAIIMSERTEFPEHMSYGWARAQMLGAFFNGVFLLALGISIFLQSIERFVSMRDVESPMYVFIMGCVGLGLNIISAIFLHGDHAHHGHSHGHAHGHSHGADEEVADGQPFPPPIDHPDHLDHRHTRAAVAPPGRDLGMLGVLIHVIGDALNNIGVIIAAAVIWHTKYEGRFYADPGVSMGISIMILLTSLPLIKSSGSILLQSAPEGFKLEDVKHDLERIPGIDSIHELHIWRLDQRKAIATAHVVVPEQSTVSDFLSRARTAVECLHAYGVHSVTLQPELAAATPPSTATTESSPTSATLEAKAEVAACQLGCGTGCGTMTCCRSLSASKAA